MTIDYSSLRRAVEAHKRIVQAAEKHEMTPDFDQDTWEAVRGGVIKSFEVAYELAWKMMQRWLKTFQDPNLLSEQRTKQDLFRNAAKFGLIDDPTRWFRYLNLRNLTTHTYDELPAQEVYEGARDFLVDAMALLERLEASDG